jgi:hypothetical protein
VLQIGACRVIIKDVSRALLLTLLCAACSDGHGEVDFYVKRDGCKASCAIDRFDLFVLQGSCVYAWRVGVGDRVHTLGEVAEVDDQVTVQVLGRCGAESCPRCAGQHELTVGASAGAEIALQGVQGCTVPGRVTNPCTACLPGPDAYCDGNHRVTCPASGRTLREACPKYCVDGRCEQECQKTIFYEDDDGDTYGDPSSQTEACTRPAGYAERGGDCDDDDPRVHPGQTAYFTAPGANGWDYDCNNVVEKQFPLSMVHKGCQADGGGVCDGGRWMVGVPGCGQEALFIPCVKDITGCNEGMMFKKKQACR